MPANPSSDSPVPYSVRADMFQSLAAMETAGLPFLRALALIKLPKRFQVRLTQTIKLISQGENLAIAGKKTGLFSPLESNLLKAALVAGSPASTYRRLAQTYHRSAMQAEKLKARLLFPLSIFVLALFIQPLPDLVKGSLGIGSYLAQCLLPLTVLGSLVFLAIQLLRQFDRLLLRVPVIGAIHEKRCNTDFFENLGLLLEAGVPMFDALPVALDTIRNSIIKNKIVAIESKIIKGASLTQALKSLPYFADSEVIGFIETGEGSGTLPEMLFRYTNAQHESINHLQQQLMDWLPRLVYAVVAGYLAYGLLYGNGIATSVAPELG